MIVSPYVSGPCFHWLTVCLLSQWWGRIHRDLREPSALLSDRAHSLRIWGPVDFAERSDACCTKCKLIVERLQAGQGAARRYHTAWFQLGPLAVMVCSCWIIPKAFKVTKSTLLHTSSRHHSAWMLRRKVTGHWGLDLVILPQKIR